MGIRDSRLQIVPGGKGPIFGATDAGSPAMRWHFWRVTIRSHGKSHTPAPSPLAIPWSESALAGRKTVDILNRYDVVSAPELCAGSRESGSRSRFEATIETVYPSDRAGKLPKNDVGVRVALVVTLQEFAEVAELVDALDLGSSGETRPGSSPGFRMVFLTVAQSSAYAHYADKKIISPRLPCGSRHQQASNLTA